jgi:hypothetical protein
MNPLIDAELEKLDRRHAQLTKLSTHLLSALDMYHSLMCELPAPPVPPNATGPHPSMGMPGPGGLYSYAQGAAPVGPMKYPFPQGPIQQPASLPAYANQPPAAYGPPQPTGGPHQSMPYAAMGPPPSNFVPPYPGQPNY